MKSKTQPWKRSATARRLIQRSRSHFIGKDGRIWRWLKIGEDIDDTAYYWDDGDKTFRPTTNSSNTVNHAKMYAHPLKYQEPCGCLDWKTVLTT